MIWFGYCWNVKTDPIQFQGVADLYHSSNIPSTIIKLIICAKERPHSIRNLDFRSNLEAKKARHVWKHNQDQFQ